MNRIIARAAQFTTMARFLRRVMSLLLTAAVAASLSGTYASAQAPFSSATPPPQPACRPSLQITDLPKNQDQFYAGQRSFEALKGGYSASFPNLAYFTGLNCERLASSYLIGDPPSYIPPCAPVGGSAAMPGLEPPKRDLVDTVNHQIEQAEREFHTLVYRLRACDYQISVIAWNTLGRGLDDTMKYAWTTSCNSFANENTNAATQEFSSAESKLYSALDALQNPKPGAKLASLRSAFDAAYADFAFARYDQYDDLSQRLQSCAAAASYSYSPNRSRFFCNYGGFLGVLLTASATAFGKHWGGSSTSTQSQVQGLGTVMIALPALCQGSGGKR
jgi:hypothetical protein